MSTPIENLAEALRQRNAIDFEIGEIIGRPPEKGHIGEFIASQVFGIDLAASATNKGADGTFRGGQLRGRSVNVKLYGKREGILDINPEALPDYYLVLAGPKAAPGSSRGGRRPVVIESVYLFDAPRLVTSLATRQRRPKIGIASSIAQVYWRDAEVYPNARNTLLALTEEQRETLAMFSTAALGASVRSE